MDGLAIFIDKTWEKIRTQKELNLPDQRVMVANLRCNELKEEAIEKVRNEVQNLTLEANEKRLKNFSERCRSILKVAISHYEEFAHQYD